MKARLGRKSWHHRRIRRVADEHQHCSCNGVTLCTTCHAWVHANPVDAGVCGWIVSSHEADPSLVPVLVDREFVRLNHDGTSEPFVPIPEER